MKPVGNETNIRQMRGRALVPFCRFAVVLSCGLVPCVAEIALEHVPWPALETSLRRIGQSVDP